MDLSQLDTSVKSAEGAVMYLRHPIDGSILEHEKDGVSTKMFTLLLGQDSDKFLETLKQTDELKKQSDDDEIVGAAALTVDGELFLDGEWLELDSKKAIDIYTRFKWIREQVSAFVFDRRNFFPEQNLS